MSLPGRGCGRPLLVPISLISLSPVENDPYPIGILIAGHPYRRRARPIRHPRNRATLHTFKALPVLLVETSRKMQRRTESNPTSISTRARIPLPAPLRRRTSRASRVNVVLSAAFTVGAKGRGRRGPRVRATRAARTFRCLSSISYRHF